MIKNQRKFVDSIEHMNSPKRQSDIKTECVDLGGNQYSEVDEIIQCGVIKIILIRENLMRI